jgi:hypothetical protein
MSKFQGIVKRLNEIIDMEGKEPLDQLGSYIVGALIVDEIGFELYQSNETVERIAELGSDLEISNGSNEELQEMWEEIKALVAKLDADIT